MTNAIDWNEIRDRAHAMAREKGWHETEITEMLTAAGVDIGTVKFGNAELNANMFVRWPHDGWIVSVLRVTGHWHITATHGDAAERDVLATGLDYPQAAKILRAFLEAL